jgi:hypothetical protein
VIFPDLGRSRLSVPILVLVGRLSDRSVITDHIVNYDDVDGLWGGLGAFLSGMRTDWIR